MKNVLLTGASGFVGKNLTPYLQQTGFHVVHGQRYLFAGTTVSNSDILNDCIGIVHMAGKAHDTNAGGNQDRQEYLDINTDLTKKVFSAFLASRVQVFIYFSSVKAVADSVEGVLTEEEAPLPKTNYGISKQLAEKYILQHESHPGKRIYILRPCMIHGPSNKGNLNLLFQFVKRGLPWPLAAFQNKRSFCSIYNVCFVINELLTREDIPSGIYNVADDEAISTNSLVMLLADSLNKKIKLLRVPKKVIKIMARIGDLLHLPFTSERLQKLTENYIVDNSKLKNALGKPLPVATRAGLISTFKSFT